MTFKKEWSVADILQLLNLVVVAASAWYVVKQLDLGREQLQSSNEQLRQNRVAQETMLELERRNKALEYIARWNSEEMVNLRAKALHSKAGEEDQHSVQAFLSFYEELALAVLNRSANPDMCLRFFRNMLNAAYSRFQKVIEEGPGYSHLKQLHKGWQQAPATLPPLPFDQNDAKSKSAP